MMKKTVCGLFLFAAAGACAWPAGTPQKNPYILPPASDAVKVEAAEAYKRLARDLKPSWLVGHRGDSEFAPENTMPAFRASAEKGFNIEADLYLSLDGVIYLTHDLYHNRPGSGLKGYATNVYWKGQVEKADAGAWKGEKWKGTKYPTIDELLTLAQDGRFIILELKDPRKDEILSVLKEAIARHPNVNPGNVYLQGGGRARLRHLPQYRDIACQIPRKGWRISDPPRDMMAYVKKMNPKHWTVLSLRWDEEIVTRELVDTLHKKGMKILVWTVNDAASAWAAFGRGVDWVCTDRPSAMWQELTSKTGGL